MSGDGSDENQESYRLPEGADISKLDLPLKKLPSLESVQGILICIQSLRAFLEISLFKVTLT